jgi:8-oxo-dGTP pyrophosphatase MutT (NUDIX family)
MCVRPIKSSTLQTPARLTSETVANFCDSGSSSVCLAICEQPIFYNRMKSLKQVGALCVCEADDETPLILLVTSRDTGRWVIPKGWPAKRLKAHEAAAREAMEEGGVVGKVETKPIGSFSYHRPHQNGDQLHSVSVYLVAVRSALEHWPEEEERKRAWFSVSAAARLVAEPELRSLISRIGMLTGHPKWRCVSDLTKSPVRNRQSKQIYDRMTVRY